MHHIITYSGARGRHLEQELKDPNSYSLLGSITMTEPRAFARRLADAGAHNGVGTFDLCATSAHPACRVLNLASCPAAAGWTACWPW
ncbi:hypothetical protein ACIBCT_38625 [Streptosporangium sp. NPDC050855]|uniref:hypothetical protein n=1 Tax=Streptosporangium sp. NPDC050855 TaxID=3366194 RepID=UPI0037B28D89